jgi:hypothetical protein
MAMRFSDSNRDNVRAGSIRRRNSHNKNSVATTSNNNRNKNSSTTTTDNNNSNTQILNIDGFFYDSFAVAAILTDRVHNIQSREITFRNVLVDATVLQGADKLLRQRTTSSALRGDEAKESSDRSSNTITNNNIEIIHCSGLVSELIRIVLPTTRRFGFAGNIPIAHNLDTEGLSVIGENLGKEASLSSRTADAGNGDNNHGGGERNDRVRLKTLVLKGTRLESSGFNNFCDGLGANTTLEDLQLSNCILEEDDVLLLASALRNNTSLKSVFFANCKFGTKARPPSDNTTASHDNHHQQHQQRRETTQSINNTYPQAKLPIVLEAMVRHPSLESLKIYDMCCNEHAIRAIGDILSAPESKLRHLGLKNNLSHPQSNLPGVSNHLFQALWQNPNLTYLKLSGNNLNDENMIQLGRILTESETSIRTLSITDNLISDGLLPLASRLSDVKSLRCLEVLRNPITDRSKKAMVSALENNVQLERLDLDGSWDEEKFWWLSLNRGGRRVLQASDKKTVLSSLWPTILERAYNIPFRRNSKQPSSNTNIEIVYYLIRRIPWLFEKASASKAFPRHSKPEKKRHRKRVVKVNCTEAEPKAKRKFSA